MPLTEQSFERFRGLDFYARQVVEGFLTGRHRSPFHGFSAEFSDYRQYNPGESTRHIDWHLYGRTDKLFVKRFEEETNLRCQLVIDRSASMLYPLERQGNMESPNKLTFSVLAAAALTELLMRQRDAFGLTLVSDGIDQHTPCRASASHRRYLFSLLDPLLAPVDAGALPPKATHLAEPLHLLAEQLHRRSMVVIFTDALVGTDEREPLFDALRHLRHNRHEVVLFHTFDRRAEVELDLGKRPVQLVDLESGRQLRLNPAEAATLFRTQTEETHAELRHRALQYHIDYEPVDIGKGFDAVLLPFLLKRSRL